MSGSGRPSFGTRERRPGFTLIEVMIVVVIIGVLAALAIPSFQRIMQRSQDYTIINNAWQLSNAADQYYLTNGFSTVAAANLVGSTNFIKQLNQVGNESYPGYYTQGVTIGSAHCDLCPVTARATCRPLRTGRSDLTTPAAPGRRGPPH